MSLYGALFSGVSGLKAQSAKLAVISDNISNVNTVGYKGGQGIFRSLVTTGGGVIGAYSPGGVIGGNRQLISQQGLIQTTSSPTDIAISGSGFFVVNQTSDGSGQVLYTRAGSFIQDSTGNFRNTAGFFLQAWPLDRDGRLPGEPGNANTVSSASLTSLRTVNVQSLTGVATATTGVSVSANLNATQLIFPGSGATANMDSNDTVNASNKAADIIIPQGIGSVDSLTAGDVLNITTGANPTGFSYTYGGFTFSRVVGTGAVGDSGVSLPANSTTLTQSAVALGNNPAQTIGGAGTTTVRITLTAHGLANNDVVTLSGLTAFDGLVLGELNATHVISNITANTFDITVTTGATAGGVTGGGNAGMSTTEVFKTTNTDNTVRVRHASHGLVDGEVVTLSGMDAALAGIPAADFSGSFVVTVIDANHYEIEVATAATATTGGDGTTNVVGDRRPYAATGFILDAATATQSFLGTTGTSIFTTAALSFTISDGTNTNTFTYTASAPNAQSGQFNNLTNLAEAISATGTLTARVANGRLYVSAIDAQLALTFANGSSGGTAGGTAGTALYGIDWVEELGLANVGALGNRFSSLQGLADLVNATSGLSASISNPLSDSSLFMNVDDPLETITFVDGGSNTGSVVATLGLVTSLNGAAYAQQTTGALGPAYDPTVTATSMAGGGIQPQFSRPIRVFDSLGQGHDLNISFIKLNATTWAVEIYAIDPTEVTAANGLIAFGNIAFNGDSSLQSVASALTAPITIDWASSLNDPADSVITFDWGTAGVVGVGDTDGMSQFASAYKVNFVNQNGAPVGELTGVAIDEDGFITASYSNGESQQLFKIPLAQFANPDQLTAVSGNAYNESPQSGQVNLVQAGAAGAGKVAASSLEQSNVELSEQLTDMIIAQRAYQANTKIISTSADLLRELNDVLR